MADLPGSVRTRADYGDLLCSFHSAHALLEPAVFAPAWDLGWRDLGIDIVEHRRLELLADDLATLGLTPTDDPSRLSLTSQAEALGCLYVLEGSAIGRRILSPLLREQLGDVPSSFFDGSDRQPLAWRGVQRALGSLAGAAGPQRAVVAGARTAFEVFLHQFRRRALRPRLSIR